VAVYFDISTLGYGAQGPAFRTGVFRSVEHLAKALLDIELPGLSLCAIDSPEAWALSLDYWRRGPLAKAPFHSEGGYGAFRALHPKLIDWNSREKAGPLRRLSRRALKEAVERVRPPAGFPRLPADGLYHSPFYPLPAPVGSKPRVLTIHDLINLLHPEVSPGTGEFLRTIVSSLHPEDQVVCVSSWTRDELLGFAPQLDPKKVSVIGWAADETLKPPTSAQMEKVQEKYGLGDEPYFLAVATQEKRKNLSRLILAFEELRRRRPDCEARLALVGFEGSGSSTLRRSEGVRFLGYVADEALPALYGGSLAFAFPSLYEGFGLPALEAMACGAPVLSSNTSALLEVVGDGGWLLDPKDTGAWSHALEKLYDSKSDREEWRAKGAAWVRRFSWRQTATQYAAVYRAVSDS
jgi:glycosyltransferase involved in cell wall biosynthesis